MPVVCHGGSCLEFPWSQELVVLCVEPKAILVVPWAHGFPWWGFSFLGTALMRDHPGCRLAGSPGLVHAALDRAGSGMLRPGQPDWTVSLDCCVIFIPTNLLLLPVYTLQRSNKMYLRPEQTRNILERGIKGMTSWNT